MEIDGKTVLVCDCTGTMPLDGKALRKACTAAVGNDVGEVAPDTLLCRAQIGNFEAALKKGRELVVACTQEAPFFAETRAELGLDNNIRFVNIRERAGWSEEADKAMPKIAALLAEAAIDVPPTASVSMRSQGIALVYGRDETAIAAAKRLGARLDCTVLLTKPASVAPPRLTDVPIFRGTIARAKGHLGAFEITVDDYAPALPASRGQLGFERARDGASSKCDIILDLTGGTPLFQAHEKRDGYFRADPKDPAAVERAIYAASDMIGEFEKPRYIAYQADICTHSRNTKKGCNRCLDVCPTGAIASAGDHVDIDPYVCAGCGSCASVCPTGAATYALPEKDTVLDRLRTLLVAYGRAGGSRAVLLVHDGKHGEEVIDMIARHGRGLPAHVLPFAVNEITQVGFDFMACALAFGAAQVRLLVDPEKRDELAGLAGQIGLAETAMSGLGFGEGRVAIIDDADPETVEALLYGTKVAAAPKQGGFLPTGGKREVTLLALRHLHEVAPAPVDVLPLAAGSPFGTLAIDTAGCTLCLSCVGTCPTGALIDNPDMPQLRFIQEACVQCGLCKATCPEKVIQLKPQLDFTSAAKSPALVKEEEPACCVRCGKPFGTLSAIENVTAKLADKHWMFQKPEVVERIRMCEDCRLIRQAEAAIDPFAGPPRPLTRTTEDDLRENERAKRAAEQQTTPKR
ncbi:MAG: 4Fe-4S dicluster domain-containing protein [Rhodospirillales bacterium]|jgi:ferredoxin